MNQPRSTQYPGVPTERANARCRSQAPIPETLCCLHSCNKGQHHPGTRYAPGHNKGRSIRSCSCRYDSALAVGLSNESNPRAAIDPLTERQRVRTKHKCIEEEMLLTSLHTLFCGLVFARWYCGSSDLWRSLPPGPSHPELCQSSCSLP